MLSTLWRQWCGRHRAGHGARSSGPSCSLYYLQRAGEAGGFSWNVFYHEVSALDYPLFQYQPYESALASKIVDVVKFEQLDILHVHYAIPHASAALMAKSILREAGVRVPFITTLTRYRHHPRRSRSQLQASGSIFAQPL
jgi:hypothetical protein